MILDHLINSNAYESLHPRFAQAFKFLKETDLNKIEPGRIELDGKNLFVIIDHKQGKLQKDALLEAHNMYIDIQLCISGEETMGWKYRENCKTEKEPFNTEKDIVFFTDQTSTYFKLMPMHFAVFFPKDAHAPFISDGNIKKVVIKVAI